jgi:hypothetical protein
MVEGGQSRGGRQRRWNFNGTDYGIWKWERGGDGVLPFSEGKRRRRQGGSTVSEADDTAKSDVVIGVWRSKITKGNWVSGPKC